MHLSFLSDAVEETSGLNVSPPAVAARWTVMVRGLLVGAAISMPLIAAAGYERTRQLPLSADALSTPQTSHERL